MEPLISIIIPAYNIQEYIGRCLDSVIDQTYKNLEIIVVNDGSTDYTGAIIDQYAKLDKRIVALHRQNGGVSKARNLGIETANGDYIGFVDGDDTAETDIFELLLKGILKFDADISCCGYKKIYPNKTINYYDNRNIITLNNVDGLKSYLNAHLTDGVLYSKLYKAKLFDKIRLNENLKYAEDSAVNYYLFSKANKTVYMGGLKYNYIVREKSACTTKVNINMMNGTYQMANEVLEHAKVKNEIYPSAFNSYIRFMCIISLLALKSGILDDKCEAFKKKVEDEIKNNINCIIRAKGLKLKYKVHAVGIVYFYPFYSWLYKRVVDSRRK